MRDENAIPRDPIGVNPTVPVLGLHVAVQDPLLVHVVQATGCGHHRGHRSLERQACGSPIGEGAPGQQLHDEEALLLGLAIIEHPNHVRMVERREDPCFPTEARHVLGIRRPRPRELLDRRVAVRALRLERARTEG